MNVRITGQQEEEIRSFERKGDSLLGKGTFEGCLEAQDAYLGAMELLQKYAQDDSVDDGISGPHFKTDSISYKNWHFALKGKLNRATAELANPKTATK